MPAAGACGRLACGYLSLLLLAPLAMIFYKTFEHGLAPPIDAITSPDGLHALKLTLLTVAIAVPLNTIFGVGCALLLVRNRWKGNAVIDAVINLPFAISPIVVGLSLFLLYGTGGWLGPTLAEAGIKVLFSVPGIVLASIFVSLPFVVRETVPVLQEIGTDRSRPPRPWAPTPGRPSGDHPAGDPLGRRLRRRADHGPRARRVRRRDDRLRLDLGPDPDAAALRREAVSELQPARGLSAPRRARRCSPFHPSGNERPQDERRTPDGNHSRGSQKRFGDFQAPERCIDRGPGRLADRPAGPERQRQVDPAAGDRRARDARRRPRPDRRRGRLRPSRRRSAKSASSSSTTPPSST